MNETPTTFEWTGEAMVPVSQFMARKADECFVIGDTYRLVEHHDRSMNSHRHYFAALHDAWASLPENEAERFPSSEHFRKWCLIKCGYADQRQHVCASKAEALRLQAFVRPLDEYAVVTCRESVVTVWTAQSQSVKAMGRQAFQASKQAVLDLAASMIGVDPQALSANAGLAA